MQGNSKEIKITETETEYLLFIPPDQRHRAKKVGPITFEWGDRRCWVYHRNISKYYALIKEFADDLTSSSSFTNPQEDEQKRQWQGEIDGLKDTVSKMKDIISTKDDEIESLQAGGRQKDEVNSKLQEEIDRLRPIAESISAWDERLSNKDSEIQSLNDEIRNKIGENRMLKTQISQLRDINTHPEIRNIAVKATGDDPVFRERFSRIFNIDTNLPVELRKWLEELLMPSAYSHGNLDQAINQYSNFKGQDKLLAHVIRTQGNLSAHHSRVDERTRMGRALCCFFAAALLSPQLPDLG